MLGLAKGRGINTNLAKSNIRNLIKQIISISLILNIEVKEAVLNRKVQSLVLCTVIDPESDRQISIYQHCLVVLINSKIVNTFYFILNINWLISSIFSNKASTSWLFWSCWLCIVAFNSFISFHSW